jgi:hypothetical protein
MQSKIKSYPYTRQNISKIVFVSGNTRSGKVIILKLISSFNKMEKVNANFLMEQANFLNYIKKIDQETAIYFLRRAFSIMDYNLRISREVNFKKSDYTSIFNFKNPSLYLNRLKQKEGDIVVKKLSQEKNTIPLMIHNALLTTNLFKAFKDYKLIEMIRNPVDQVFSWINKDYGDKFYNSYRASILTLKFNNKLIPYYAYGWEKKYLKLNKYERIIEMFNILEKQKKRTLSKIDTKIKKKILQIRFEELIQNPEKIINKIEIFLGKKRTHYTNKVLIQENLPRSYLSEVDKKRKFLKKKISKKYFNKLLMLEKNYIKNF